MPREAGQGRVLELDRKGRVSMHQAKLAQGHLTQREQGEQRPGPQGRWGLHTVCG